MLSPGIQEVTKKKAYEMIKLGRAELVTEVKKPIDNNSSKGSGGLQAGELEKLQQEAEQYDIDIDGKSAEELDDEIELAKELDLKD